MVAFNAFGDYVPPMILFPGERLRDIGLSGFPEVTYAATMDSHLLNFLRVCVHLLRVKILSFRYSFVDGHSTHISLPAAEYCMENGIILYCLLPNTTHSSSV